MSHLDKDLKWRLSMLHDSELDGHGNPRLLDRLEGDRKLQMSWARYHLIGQVMRSPGAMLADADFAARVSAAIRDEPTILSPGCKPARSDSLRHRVVTFALAASLAGVAVMIGKSLNDHAGNFVATATQQHAVASVGVKGSEAIENMADAQFNDYLLMHSETATMAGSAGMLPYVRLVSAHADR